MIPHFRAFPLMSGKRLDFERFAAIFTLMAGGAHRRRDGLIQIVTLARAMNPSGKRRYNAEVVLAQLHAG